LSPEEREQMLALCQRITSENDHEVFLELVKQLHELLNGKDGHPQHNPGSHGAKDDKS
jgi:hypothetical protein